MRSDPGEDSDSVEPSEDKNNGVESESEKESEGMGSEPRENSDSVEPSEDKSNGIMAWNLNQKMIVHEGMGSEPGEDSDSVEPLEPGEESELPQEAA